VLFEAIAPAITDVETTSSTKWSIVVYGLVVLFIAQSILQTRPNGRFANWLQPHLLSGLYIDDLFTRWTFRLWPPGLE
jgi:NAD(P)H-quinone oxidoreductase subunit 5